MMDEQSLVGRGGGVGRRKNEEELKTSQVHSSDWEGGFRWAYQSHGGRELSPQEKVSRTSTHACRVLQRVSRSI